MAGDTANLLNKHIFFSLTVTTVGLPTKFSQWPNIIYHGKLENKYSHFSLNKNLYLAFTYSVS